MGASPRPECPGRPWRRRRCSWTGRPRSPATELTATMSASRSGARAAPRRRGTTRRRCEIDVDDRGAASAIVALGRRLVAEHAVERSASRRAARRDAAAMRSSSPDGIVEGGQVDRPDSALVRAARADQRATCVQPLGIAPGQHKAAPSAASRRAVASAIADRAPSTMNGLVLVCLSCPTPSARSRSIAGIDVQPRSCAMRG